MGQIRYRAIYTPQIRYRAIYTPPNQIPGYASGIDVCPSVRHTLLPYENDASWDHEVFTVVSCAKDSIFRIREAFREIPDSRFEITPTESGKQERGKKNCDF